MILLAHMLFGAAIGSLTKNIPLAMTLAFLSHYFLDIFPHIEYLQSTESSIVKIKSGNWKKYVPDILKVLLDFSLGIVIISLFSQNNFLIYLCAIIAVIPDGLTIITLLFPNPLLKIHHNLHTKKIHYLTKEKHFPLFWKVVTQVFFIAISIYLF